LEKQIQNPRRKRRRNNSSQIDPLPLLALKSLMILHNNPLFQNVRERERKRKKKLLHLLLQLKKNLVQPRRMLPKSKNILRISSAFKLKLKEKLQLKNRPKSNKKKERTK
jgi:hypothetical protein